MLLIRRGPSSTKELFRRTFIRPVYASPYLVYFFPPLLTLTIFSLFSSPFFFIIFCHPATTENPVTHCANLNEVGNFGWKHQEPDTETTTVKRTLKNIYKRGRGLFIPFKIRQQFHCITFTILPFARLRASSVCHRDTRTQPLSCHTFSFSVQE